MIARAHALALLGLACALGGGSCGDEKGGGVAFEAFPEAEDDPAKKLAADDRIAWLLAPCGNPAPPILGDTTDPIAILIEKLDQGELDPFRLAKSELAAMGEAALPALRRYCEAHFADPDGAQRLLNGVGVIAAMPTDAGRDVLLTALGHNQDTVRVEAIRGLAVHGKPEDYDRIRALVPVSPPGTQNEIGAALFRCDRARAEDEFADWLEGPREHAAVWLGAVERLAATERPEMLDRFPALVPKLEGGSRLHLLAALARRGDEEPLEELRAALADPSVEVRSAAVHALENAGLVEEFAPLLVGDRDETLRGLVARAIAAAPRSRETDAWLRKGTLDRAKSVQVACLRALAERGDAEAFDQAVTLLEGPRADLEIGLQVLRVAWPTHRELAERSLALLEALRSGSEQPARVEPATLDRAIAQIPLVEAARILYDRGRTVSGEIDQLPAHRWYLMQAGNTGAEGRAWLRERWDEELDPVWRVDIVAASSFEKDEPSRQFLIRILFEERTTPLEILHAANLLVRHGPTATVAPVLKRAVLRVEDEVARPALNCLLDRWYGVRD